MSAVAGMLLILFSFFSVFFSCYCFCVPRVDILQFCHSSARLAAWRCIQSSHVQPLLGRSSVSLALPKCLGLGEETKRMAPCH